MKSFNHTELKQWEKDLIFKYPEIYLQPSPMVRDYIAEYKWNPDDSCNLRYGFEFQEGWKDLVDKFSKISRDFIMDLYKNGYSTDKFYIKACIFKQKFGRLTWQGDVNLPYPYADIYRGYIAIIEEESLHICEKTGVRGQLRNIHGYMVTLCDDEYTKALNKK